MSVVAAIRAMLAQGLTVEQALAAAEAIELSAAPKPTARQERNRRYYEARKASEKRLNPSESVLKASETSELRRGVSPSPAPLPEKETPPPAPPLKKNKPSPDPTLFPTPFPAREFDAFWQKFPNKVGKADASKAFDRARKRVEFSVMLEALDRYVAKTDDRPWCNPSTWLNQDRWTDAPAQTARGSPRGGGNGPKGLEWFDEAINWIDENERKRAETSVGAHSPDAGGAGQLRLSNQR